MSGYGEMVDTPASGENCHVGSSQGRKPDDECHRLRQGREKSGTDFIVTRCQATSTIKIQFC